MIFRKLMAGAVILSVAFCLHAKTEKKQVKKQPAEVKKQNSEVKTESASVKKFMAPVQIIIPSAENLSESEKAWLPGQLQDKIKSNFQEYLGMRTVVDARAEKELLKIQAASENLSHDETTSIEIGKITNAKFAVFPTLRKTANGYTLNMDFTDLTTGEQLASAISKEYTKSEYLYGTTGAIDELTLKVAEKLDIPVSEITKSLLTSGSADFTVDAQLALAKQNEEAYRRQQSNLDAEIARLSSSTDINAVQNKKKLEAEKALLIEKQNAEKKRQQELAEQKKRAAEDEKLEAERSIALKTQRDQMAKDAAAKAAEVRRLKLEKQGVLGQINVLESKKKALVEIRQGVENRRVELYEQMLKDKEAQESKIRERPLGTSEKDENGNQTERSKQIRENQVIKSNEELTNKFFADCEAVKKATASQDAALLAEIRKDQKILAATRTVSSMGEELKVSYGKFTGAKDGWVSYISLYSDGILIYTDEFILSYEGVTGKNKPTDEELEDFKVSEEYDNNIDMYNSLLTRGDPIIYFEIDYNVNAENDDKPSQYRFNFNKIRVINTVSGMVTQDSTLDKVQPRAMKPEWELREFAGIVEKERNELEGLKKYISKGMNLNEARKSMADVQKLYKEYEETFVKIPGKNYAMMKTEVTQKLYTTIMESNPSLNKKDDSNPVENVSWYDAIYFCNKLSEKFGYTPVYSINGTTDVSKWNYTPHSGKGPGCRAERNNVANGFRLPTIEEWVYAANGGQNYKYSGSDNLNEVGWHEYNSKNKTHPVAQKMANGYGLYDMSGNVWEWCWNFNTNDHYRDYRYYCGGGYGYVNENLSYHGGKDAYYRDSDLGFRIVRNVE